MEFKMYRLNELLINCDYLRKPLSSMERDDFKGEYPYYGAQGIIDYVKDFRCDGRFLLIAEDGENLKSRKQPIAQIAEGKFWVNNHAHIVQTKDETDIFFMCYALNYLDITGYITGSAQPKLSQGNLNKIKVLFPNIMYQKKISKYLRRYDDLIENNNKRIKLLEQMAEELYKEWFVRFRFPGYVKIEFIDSIPSNFNIRRIADLVALYRGKSYSSTDIAEGSMTLLSMNNIRPFGGFLRDFSRPYNGDYREIHVLHDGDLIMCITDMTQERRVIGYVGLVTPCDKKMIACTHLIKLVPYKIDTLFLYSMFTFSSLSRDISMRSTGTNVLGLTADIIKKVKVLIPEQPLIDMYVEKVRPIFDSIKKLQLANENLVKQRDLLLPRLMSGKIDVEGKEVI